MNINTSTKIQHVYRVDPKLYCGCFGSRSSTPFIASWVIGLDSVTERALAGQYPESPRCKVPQSKKLFRLRSELLGGMFFAALNYGTRENR